MKVTRLKRGYRIVATDTEYELLSAFESMVTAGDVAEILHPYLTPREKAAFTRRLNATGGFFLTIDEDRRDG